ncbi:MAG: squalene/phytoene synthase family protein [Alphaproteobacteria bacterium]
MSNERPDSTSRSRAPADPLGALRASDRDRFLQVLMASSGARPALLALFLFNLELARVADQVREPMAGFIRLQWWRDALVALAQGTPPPHPILDAMAETGLAARLDVAALVALVDARELELDATPLKRVDDLEAHARATAGGLNALAARLLALDDARIEAARTAGTAYGLVGIVRAVPFVIRRSQPLLPEEPLAARGLAPQGLASESAGLDALRPVLAQITERAGERLAGIRADQGRAAAAAFVPAVLARQDLARLRRRDFDVFDGRLAERPPWTAARLLLAATLGRY